MNKAKQKLPDYVDASVVAEYRRLLKKNHRRYWIMKRTFDIVVSFCILVILLPFFIIISLVIFIDDPHASPIYSQTRIGRHGKEFKLYKFRTMVFNADEILHNILENNEHDGLAFKIKDDPRITRVGRFLRKTSIDELPQFYNVLKGDMSIVGPRPALPGEVGRYTEHQKVRLMVTPGLTCYWQVTPNRNDILFSDWMDMDVDYIAERSFPNDLKLIFKTIGVMFRGEGR